MADTAYINLALGVHTDTTYSRSVRSGLPYLPYEESGVFDTP